MTFLPTDHRTRIYLFVLLVCAAFFRFYQIDSIPGLDHDEALICLGARSVADMSAHPATGDKVYESPVLEYLGGIAFSIFGSSDTVLRVLIGCIGLLGVFAVFQIGRFVFGWRSGVLAGIMMALSPWAIASSRVIYASNLVVGFLPLAVMTFFASLHSSHRKYIFSTGLFLGLAASGRITVLVFWIPFLIGWRFFRHDRVKSIAYALILSILPVMPMLGFNFVNGWPAIQVFADPVQSHSLLTKTAMADGVSRIVSFFSAAVAAADGSRFWVDINREGSMWIRIVVLIFIAAGLVRMVMNRSANTLMFLAVLCLPILIVPITTKTIHLSETHVVYHPHYLDMMMPWVFVIMGFGIEFLFNGIARFSGFRWINLMVFPLMIVLMSTWLLMSIYPAVQQDGGPGRWNNRYERLAKTITRNPAYSSDILVIDSTFGMGLPQMMFLAPQFRIFPFIGQFTGIRSEVGDMREKTIIGLFNSSYLSMFSRAVPGLVLAKVDDSCIAYRYRSPAVTCDATFDRIDMPGMRLRIECDDADPPGVSGRISDFKGNEELFRLILRMDTYTEDPSIRQTAERVSIRHQQFLSDLADRLSDATCSGMIIEGNSPVTITFRREGQFWHCHYRSEGRDISGLLLGEVLFF